MLEDFKVITFYQFINLEDLGKLAQKLKCFCNSNKIRGSVILASEGINGTLAGLSNNINEFLYNKYLNEFHSSCIIDNEFKEIEVENLIKRISNV